MRLTNLNLLLCLFFPQSYSSVNQLTGYTGPDNVRDRYAQTINQLANNRTAQQFRVLKAFVPILRDIIRVEKQRRGRAERLLRD